MTDHPYQKYRLIADVWNRQVEPLKRNHLSAEDVCRMLILAAELEMKFDESVQRTTELQMIQEHLELASNGI